MKEHRFQHDCWIWAWNTYRAEILIFAVPNEITSHPGLVPGCADLVLVHRGRAHFIELKGIGGRVSAAQRAFEEHALSVGATYRVIWGLEEFKAYVEELILR